MPYQVLARKYRPQRFADVAGQDHVTRTLQNALEQGRIAHGYIFSGHRGIGKTTIARILACALNCHRTIGSPERPTPEPCLTCDACLEIRAGNAVDVIEIDAATNRGIDEIRELRDAARYRPARDRFKIYILDEAHQITDAAFNALLKTLEEPPDHIVFMMATTEPENIPQTIRSRCQHFSFHAVKLDDILGELRGIAAHEGVAADEAALSLLAEAGDGSMRDALSIMDQAIASAPVIDGKAQLSAAEIRELMGTVPNTVFEEILESVARNDAATVLTTAGRLLDAGNSPSQIARQFVRYLRNCVVAKIASLTEDENSSDLLQISPDERRRAVRTALLFTEEELTRFLNVMLRTFDDLGFRQEQRLHLEMGLIKLVHLQRLVPVEEFLAQLPKTAGNPTPRVLPPQRTAIPAAPAPVPRPSTASSRFSGAPEPAAPRTQAAPAPSISTSPFASNAVESSARPVASVISQLQTEGNLALAPEPVKEPANVSPLAQPGVITMPEPSTGLNAHVAPSPIVLEEPVAISTQADENYDPSWENIVPPEEDPEATEPASQPVATGSVASGTAELQAAAVEALFATKKNNSAAEQLEESHWTIADGEVKIEVSLSKPMIGTIFRPDVEAIIKTALREKGLTGVKINVVPAAVDNKPKEPKKPRTGSVQAKALDHPTVQKAQKLFNAEISTVFDLRKD
ncbi:DNA polymerase III subunit gamma/tau [Terriglobus sp. TAA 43]|uniref:DNA polymerase III subunit gamma/tau n=1 Tax=Terriglobus sp. TAA 43 TaxID=278961 RepID=UPI000649293B|nr:DNA polymerase III subunit gamma/tau [Terriglobus sp. TAA 43]